MVVKSLAKDAVHRTLTNQRIKQSIYAGEFFYEGENAGGNAQVQLKFINTEEGRVIMTGSTPEYQYHLKDHLGNVRVTFTTVEQVENFVATVEDANADQEEGEFLNYADATKVRSKLFDNTHRDDQNQMMRAASVTDEQFKETKAEIATRLSGIGRERYGLAKSLRVMPGDVIRMEVYAKYADPAKKNWVAGFEGALSEATITAPATVVDGAMRNAAAASSALPVGALLAKPAGGVAPKAYLNYVTYDNNFVPVTDAEQTNFVQVTEAARENGSNGTPERLYAEVQVKQAGYIYVYLSNDNYEMRGEPVDVFFDDFGIQQVHSKVVQMDDYYPFGLTFNSYSRENSIENRIKFQGQEHIDDLDLGWDSFRWRNHQPEIGRFFNVDPLAEKYYYNSPYAFSENKVVAHRELEGLESEPVNPKKEQKALPHPDNENPLKGTALITSNGGTAGTFKIAGIGIGMELPGEKKETGWKDNEKSDRSETVTTTELTLGPVTVGHTGISKKENEKPGLFSASNMSSENYFGIGPIQHSVTTDTVTGVETSQTSLELFSFKFSIFEIGVDISFKIDLPKDTASPEIRRMERDNSYCGGCGSMK